MTGDGPGSPGGAFRGRRRSIRPGETELIQLGTVAPGQALPALVTPAVAGVDLRAWASASRSRVEDLLHRHGALLFKGFGIATVEQFEGFVDAACGPLLDYRHRVTRRTQLGGRVYSSTDHPPSLDLGLHNETSYTRPWPMRIAFFCVQAAPEGGETPLADSRRVLERIPESVRTRFADRKLLYLRNSGDSVELSWQETFQTDSREDVERQCRESGMDCEWRADGRLRTRQVCHAVARHPATGEIVWFNQAHLFHSSCYTPGLLERMYADAAPEDLPYNVYFGDGAAISAEELRLVRRAYDEETRVFAWEEGDVLLLDNMLVAHGRRPYRGPRRIAVAMAQPRSDPGA